MTSSGSSDSARLPPDCHIHAPERQNCNAKFSSQVFNSHIPKFRCRSFTQIHEFDS